MARVKRGLASRKKHNKLLQLAKGYRGSKSRLIKQAKESVLHAGVYAYAGRKDRKGDMRQLWITRISGALSNANLSYSQFIKKLKDANILLDRKILAELITKDPQIFNQIVSHCHSRPDRESIK